ncbi:MAG: glycosyltransferase family 2 protein [Rubrobacteraceae bacterium]
MTLLPPPEENLRAAVVVPARNEEALIGDCLDALANQQDVSHAEYEVILVLDGCTDATETRARAIAETYPTLRLHAVDGPGEGAGHARRAGMEAACARLLGLGKPSGLIASTDADTVVAPDWLATQLGYLARGARAIGGRIELIGEDRLPEAVSRWRREQGARRHERLLDRDQGTPGGSIEHWQFSGASLALTAAVYEEIGGLEPLAALEDEYLERVLQQRGVPIERPLAVKVKTSARRTGRAERGLARDLALASWFDSNTYRASDFHVEGVLKTKRRPISLLLCGEEPSAEASGVFAALQESGVLDQVIRVRRTPEANGFPLSTEAYQAEELMPDFGPIRGYGDLLWRGLSVVRGEVVVILDLAHEDAVRDRICGLLGPLLQDDHLALIKGFKTPPDQLSELIARPLINLQNPSLAGFVEPLSKDLAAHTPLLRALPFPVGPGVDISLLLDATKHVGTDSLAQVYFGEQRPPPQHETGETVYAVLAAARSRAARAGRMPVPGPLFSPTPDELTIRHVPVEERPPLESC